MVQCKSENRRTRAIVNSKQMVNEIRRECSASCPAIAGMVENEALTRKHWEKWLPEKVAELKREGRLN